MKYNILYFKKAISILIIFISVSYVFASWNEPSNIPDPSNNTAEPLNIGTKDQTKTGDFEVVNLLRSNSINAVILQISSGPVAGYVLVSDDKGLGGWKKAPAGTGNIVASNCLSGQVVSSVSDTGEVNCVNLPDPSSTTLGGVKTYNCTKGKAITAITSSGNITCTTSGGSTCIYNNKSYTVGTKCVYRLDYVYKNIAPCYLSSNSTRCFLATCTATGWTYSNTAAGIVCAGGFGGNVQCGF